MDLGRELALPYEQIIGGPLQSIIKAAALASQTTADFVTGVGMKKVNNDLVAQMVTFDLKRKKKNEDTNSVEEETVTVNAPLLTLLPIPHLRLKTVKLDFETKIQSVTVVKEDKKFGVEASAGASFWGCTASFKASYESKSAREDTTNRSATLGVHVEAEQAEMPAGLARILSILETAVTDTKK
ncbi:DUF2589 domain-containing protein [Streptomyces sp. NPDC018019]|uniref:DUF2589 domain-containing protein n=1 Tax=Streptomyces sp. NPDC018019 TaxID=3365030 RepID=UPI00379C93A0